MRSQDSSLYQRAKNFLMRRTNYETFKSIPYDQMAQSLDRIRGFLDFLGAPDKRYAIIHVAGTKGKGTVCGALDQIYRAAGYRVGLFTSPHLEEIVERFQINGRNCDKNLFAETTCALAERWKEYAALEKKRAAEKASGAADPGSDSAPAPAPPASLFDPEFLNPRVSADVNAADDSDADSAAAADDSDLIQPLTFFEWTLVIAATLFARAKVDIAILEVGMGGRFDSTNVCDADVSVLTSISFDHCEQLGGTLEAIAAEKLGIVKTNAPLVVGLGYSASLYDGLADYNARRDAALRRLDPVEPFAASAPVFEFDADPQIRGVLDDEPDADAETAGANSPERDPRADDPIAADPDAAAPSASADPQSANPESADDAPVWLPGVSGVPGVSDSGLCPVAPLFVVGDGISVRDFAYAVDPQTEITRDALGRLRDLARARADEFRAPFYSVEAVSRRVAALKAPNLDSVRRWNFEVALRVVDVLANRECAPDRRPGAGDPALTRRYPVSDAAVAVAVANFALPARFELVSRSPIIVVDGAHNRASVASLMRSVAERYPRKRVRALLATTLGKDIRGMLAELLACADEVHLSERSRDDRALSLPDLIQIAEKLLDETCPEDSPIRRKLHVVPDFRAFLADYAARPNLEDSVLVVLGSFYFAAEVRKIVRAR